MNESEHQHQRLDSIFAEIDQRQAQFVDGIAKEIAAARGQDREEVKAALLAKMPDAKAVAADAAAQSAIDRIIEEQLAKPLAQATLEGVVDASLRLTLEQTGFAEAFLENFRQSMSQADISQALGDAATLIIRRSVDQRVFQAYLDELAVAGDFPATLAERMTPLMTPETFSLWLCKATKNLAIETDFVVLLGEQLRLMRSERGLAEVLDQGAKGIVAETYASQLVKQHVKSLLVSESSRWQMDKFDDGEVQLADFIAHIQTQIRAASFRYLPWDRFVELTHGSLADDPIERPAQLPVVE